ncbi:Hypothetical_protein [Hexamita inflata]|uniref:Hypothetical_protein n=1 Tax=Hexamita inflata TaxID=28002 RepID=A0AA86NUH4_9EUKA|nr:Hypothetical protein HINF_LOCUS14065 [Hexamita inflata]
MLTFGNPFLELGVGTRVFAAWCLDSGLELGTNVFFSLAFASGPCFRPPVRFSLAFDGQYFEKCRFPTVNTEEGLFWRVGLTFLVGNLDFALSDRASGSNMQGKQGETLGDPPWTSGFHCLASILARNLTYLLAQSFISLLGLNIIAALKFSKYYPGQKQINQFRFRYFSYCKHGGHSIPGLDFHFPTGNLDLTPPNRVFYEKSSKSWGNLPPRSSGFRDLGPQIIFPNFEVRDLVLSGYWQILHICTQSSDLLDFERGQQGQGFVTIG